MTGALESTAAGREDDLAVLERIPLEDRGVPASTYEALVRAAEQWPERPAISCLPDTPQDEVAALFDKYNLITLAVVDEHGRLAGIITADDVITMLRHHD